MWEFLDNRHISLAAAACFATVAGAYILWGPSQSKKRDRKGKCPGLVNLGNSCFMNAVLQALATCPSLNRWLSTVLLKCGDGHQSKVLIPALQSVLKVLNNAEESGVYSEEYCPTEVLEALQARRWVISTDQQDAHELFHVLTETLDEESTKYPPVISLFDVVQLMETDHQAPLSAVNCVHTELPVLPARDTDSPFRGLLASQLRCTRCTYKYPVKYDTFDSLSLTLPPTAIPMLGGVAVEDLLERFVRPESVFDVDCPGCAKKMKLKQGAPLPKSTFVKKLTIGKLPQCLCVHIQRTVWRNDGLPMKRRDFVKFSESLDMEPYIYHKRKARPQSLKLGSLPGLLGGKSPKSPAPESAEKHCKRKPVSPSMCVRTPYPYPLNFLKALHYSQIQSPQRGLYLNPTLNHNQTSRYQDNQSHGQTATQEDSMESSLKKNTSLDDQSLASHRKLDTGSSMGNSSSKEVVENLNRMARSYSLEQVFEGGSKTCNQYKLCAVVEHRGDVFSGHFVTYRQAAETGSKDSNNSKMSNLGNGLAKWLYTSDTTVKWVKFNTVLAVDAYMLYYEKT